MTKIMCIVYGGANGTLVRVPPLRGSRVLDVETGRLTENGGQDVRLGECRVVDAELGQQFVDQESYRARPFLMVVEGGVADGKSKVQVLISARHPDGRPKAEASITLSASGSARIAAATPLEPGLFMALLTAPREAGAVEVRGKVDGESVVTFVDFAAAEPEPAPAVVPAVPAQD